MTGTQAEVIRDTFDVFKRLDCGKWHWPTEIISRMSSGRIFQCRCWNAEI